MSITIPLKYFTSAPLTAEEQVQRAGYFNALNNNYGVDLLSGAGQAALQVWLRDNGQKVLQKVLTQNKDAVITFDGSESIAGPTVLGTQIPPYFYYPGIVAVVNPNWFNPNTPDFNTNFNSVTYLTTAGTPTTINSYQVFFWKS